MGRTGVQAMPRLLVALLLAFLIASIAPAAAQTRLPAPVRAVLDNGLTVLVQENHAAEIVTLYAWVKVGSRDETEELNGAAHFVEHMLFKGTRRRKVGQISREVEGVGGILNASTWYDWTSYYIVVSSRFFDRMLDIQSDALMNSTFDPAEFERERLVVIEELSRREDTPSTRSFDLLAATAWTVHPYRRFPGGTRPVIRAMTRDGLFAFYRTHYVPGNVIVVVAGDVRANEVIAKARRAYGSWRGTPPPPRIPATTEPAFTSVRRAVADADVRVTSMRLGWVGPNVRDRDVYATDVLLYALGEGRASRLVRTVQDRLRLVQQLSVSFSTQADPGLFTIYAVCDPDAQARAEEAILDEVTAIRTDGITEEELRRAKTLLEAEVVIGSHTSRGAASTLGYYAAIADVDFVLTYLDRMRQVTREDVQRAAQRFLDPQRYAVAVIRPRRS
ncbi:MAG TPA: pitrilysin family protein [bacterium]|nr:pitrilysin family protein [bacterium]